MTLNLLAKGASPCTGGCGTHHSWWVEVIIVLVAVAFVFFRHVRGRRRQ